MRHIYISVKSGQILIKKKSVSKLRENLLLLSKLIRFYRTNVAVTKIQRQKKEDESKRLGSSIISSIISQIDVKMEKIKDAEEEEERRRREQERVSVEIFLSCNNGFSPYVLYVRRARLSPSGKRAHEKKELVCACNRREYTQSAHFSSVCCLHE